MSFDINSAPDWAIDIYLDLPKTLDKTSTAKVLDMSLRTLQRRIDVGEIVSCKLGSHRNSRVRIPRLEIIRYLVEHSSVVTSGTQIESE